MEDAYARYVGPRKAYIRSSAKAYPNVGTPEPYYTFHVTMGFVPVDALKAKAKSYGVSITEYLSAVLLWVLIEKQRRENPRRTRTGALAVPINLRAYFPSRTLRNFISTVRPSIDPRWGNIPLKKSCSRCATICSCTSIGRNCGRNSPAMSGFKRTRCSKKCLLC